MKRNIKQAVVSYHQVILNKKIKMKFKRKLQEAILGVYLMILPVYADPTERNPQV